MTEDTLSNDTELDISTELEKLSILSDKSRSDDVSNKDSKHL